MTAPRLALLKSYSSRMVSVCLAATGLTSGNDARPLAALGVDDHKNPAKSIHPQGHETPFIAKVRVFDRERHRVAQRLLGVGKTDAMLPKTGSGLGWVELNGHGQLCILNAYMQVRMLDQTANHTGETGLAGRGFAVHRLFDPSGSAGADL
jgi:hypothetical protein